jgi:TRAP-type C4-dicarboxylate transport system substrate-binding protein
MMKIVIAAASAAALGAVALAPAGNIAVAQDKTYTLKIANFTSSRSGTSRWFLMQQKKVAEETKGRLKLEIFFGSSMGPMPRHYDLARTGVADMSFFQHGTTRGRFPLVELMHSPYLVPPGAKGSMVATKIAADMKDVFAKEHKGTKLIWIVFNRPSGVYDAGKPIRTLEDMRGRRYRAPTPTDVAMLKSLGALPIGMPATHMAESLQKGTIDGVVTDPMGVFSFKLGEMVKYYSNMFVSVISFGLVINDKSYAALPKDLQAVVDNLGSRANAELMAHLSWGEDFKAFADYNKELAKHMETVSVTPAADTAMRAAADKVMANRIAEMEKKGLPAKETFAKLKALSAKYSKE